jgi:hypothetical protein
MIERAIYEYLQTQGALTALVGTSIYADRRPSSSGASSLTIGRVGGLPEYDLGGEHEMGRSIIEFACWTKGPAAYQVASIIMEQVRLSISGFRGTMGTTDPTVIHGCTRQNDPVYRTVSPDDGTEYWTHTIAVDYLFSYSQTRTTYA